MLETAPGSETAAAAPHGPKRNALSFAAFAGAPAVLLLVFGWLGVSAWFRQLTLPDEGRYVGVAWEMLRSGHWLVPTLDGLPFFHKPPLFYWMDAASMAVFGANEWAARFPSLMGATATAWALYLFLRRWADTRAATAALVVLITSPGFFAGAQFANHDMLVASWISTAILLAAHALLSAEAGRRYRLALLGAFACAALGVLTKGLIGAVLPFLVVASWALAARRGRALLLLVWPPGLLLFAIVCVPWFAAMQARHEAFFNYVFVDQQFRRFAQGGFNNPQPWWFYLPVLALLTLPWFAWIWKGVRRETRMHSFADVRLLMWTWILVILLFFSLPSSKLIGYILPVLPPLACVLAEGVLVAGRSRPRRMRLLVGMGAMSCLATVLVVGLFGQTSALPLAQSMRPLMAPDDRVVMLDRYVYDASFYLRLDKPALVASAWSDPGMLTGDNWRKELYDASAFDPLRARQVLVEMNELERVLCAPGITWILGDSGSVARFPWLASAQHFHESAKLSVWRWDPKDLAATPCRDTLSAGTASGKAPLLP